MTEYNELTMGIEDKLDEALAMLAAGIPLETILAEAGEHADALRPLLQIANETATLHAVPVPPPEASLQRMMAYGESLSAGGQVTPPAQPGWLARLTAPFKVWGRSFVSTGARVASIAAMVMFVFLAGTILGGSITLAAQDSLPGQRLYSLKRISEIVRLNLAWDEGSRNQLREIYNQRRWMETNLLLKQGQETDVTFDADLRSVDGSTVELDGLVIQITSNTVVNGELIPGTRVQLDGITQPPNTLVALTITVIEPAPIVPTSTPTPTSTTTPTITPTATPTLTPTATPALSQGNDTLPVITSTRVSSNENDEDDSTGDDNDDSNENNEDSSNNDNDEDSNGDDSNENDDEGDNENNDELNENDHEDSNDNDSDDNDEDSSGNDDEDNLGSGSDNSGKGNSDDRDDDKDDDDKDDE